MLGGLPRQLCTASRLTAMAPPAACCCPVYPPADILEDGGACHSQLALLLRALRGDECAVAELLAAFRSNIVKKAAGAEEAVQALMAEMAGREGRFTAGKEGLGYLVDRFLTLEEDFPDPAEWRRELGKLLTPIVKKLDDGERRGCNIVWDAVSQRRAGVCVRVRGVGGAAGTAGGCGAVVRD